MVAVWGTPQASRVLVTYQPLNGRRISRKSNHEERKEVSHTLSYSLILSSSLSSSSHQRSQHHLPLSSIDLFALSAPPSVVGSPHFSPRCWTLDRTPPTPHSPSHRPPHHEPPPRPQRDWPGRLRDYGGGGGDGSPPAIARAPRGPSWVREGGGRRRKRRRKKRRKRTKKTERGGG